MLPAHNNLKKAKKTLKKIEKRLINFRLVFKVSLRQQRDLRIPPKVPTFAVILLSQRNAYRMENT